MLRQVLRLITTIVFTTLFIFSCDVINPEEPIPSYIEIPSFDISHDKTEIGIQDAWVYVNGNFVGVFELPAHFPVIASGDCELLIAPGIKVNGTNETRSEYPFYERYATSKTLIPSESIIINPVAGYRDWANIAFSENFENTINFSTLDTNNIGFSTDINHTIQGSKCGYVEISDTAAFRVQSSSIEMPYIRGDRGMFLELNYQTESPILIGFKAYNGETLLSNNIEYMIQLFEKDEWTKLYIDLYNPMLSYLSADSFKIIFDNNGLSKNQGTAFYIDDIKIVY